MKPCGTKSAFEEVRDAARTPVSNQMVPPRAVKGDLVVMAITPLAEFGP